MDILGMLQNNIDEICEEDLEMIEEELDIGDYSFEYKKQCRSYLTFLTNRFKEEHKPKTKAYQGPQELAEGLVKMEGEVTVLTDTSDSHKNKSEEFREALRKIRLFHDPDKRFAEYIDYNDYVTNEFIDRNMNELNESERNVLLRKRDFPEEFLEKYFDVLDHGTLALNQKYSEEFFMRHYDKLPVKVVLTRSKNHWRKKANRSKKLDSFLRLKGVKI